jgi:hypothetical protein
VPVKETIIQFIGAALLGRIQLRYMILIEISDLLRNNTQEHGEPNGNTNYQLARTFQFSKNQNPEASQNLFETTSVGRKILQSSRRNLRDKSLKILFALLDKELVQKSKESDFSLNKTLKIN